VSLYTPYLYITDTSGNKTLYHNCDGNLNFSASRELDEDTHRLVLLAIEEGKRRKIKEIQEVFGII
jgi:hypothetical protein